MIQNKIIATAALAAPFASVAAQDPDNRPNIVVIVADDLLSTELSCYGGRNIATPNIDRIAAEGVQFSRCYASVAMSVPLRAAMYTGLYGQRNGSFANHMAVLEGTKTVNDYMPEEGYRVGRTGKDHPGPQSVFNFDQIPGFTVNCVAAEAPYTTDGIRDWMRKSDQPFLLYVCSVNPHAPWSWGDPSEFDPDKLVMPENCVDSPDMRKIFCRYLAEIRALDNEVGSVLETLEEIDKLDNTIVIFLGEQGPQIPGGKWTLWYPGVHSALLARYPEKIRPGTRTDAMVQYVDLLPTFLDIAGGEPRPELDGVSFKKALFGEAKTARKYAYGIHNNYPEGHPYPIRSIRDDRYALLLNLMPEVKYHEKHLMKPGGGPTNVWPAWLAAAKKDRRAQHLVDRFVTRPAVEFYDLVKDPWEEHNLTGKRKYAKKIAQMRAELEKWMAREGDRGVSMDRVFVNPNDSLRKILAAHDRAVLVKKGWIRDPYIVQGPDDMFYLTGTTPAKGDPRENSDRFNTGLGEGSIVGDKVRVWRSRDLVDWVYLGESYERVIPQLPEGKKMKGRADVLWAPELHWDGRHWILVHCPAAISNLAVSEGADVMGPWQPKGLAFRAKHDPSLFQDTDGAWYLVFANTQIARIKPDFSALAEDPVAIGPADRVIGHEGCTIRKIGKKYVLFGTGWSTDQGRKGSYNLYYCTSDNVYGPYSERRFAGRFLGHGTPFQDKRGKWWCTAFYNANVPPLGRNGIQTRDLRKDAQTINPLGVTLVPLDVTILPDGDVHVQATDPVYASPGPDENQCFR